MRYQIHDHTCIRFFDKRITPGSLVLQTDIIEDRSSTVLGGGGLIAWRFVTYA